MFAFSAAGFIATSRFGHVARGHDVEVGDVDLEARDAGDGAGGRPDLGRVVRQGREVVAEGGAHVGEAVSDELHPVAGVTGEPDDHPFQALRPAGRRCRVGHVTSFRPPGTGRRRPGPSARERRSDRRSGRGHPVRLAVRTLELSAAPMGRRRSFAGDDGAPTAERGEFTGLRAR